MECRGRARWNQLRFEKPEGDPTTWENEDYQLLEEETIYERLATLNVSLDRALFLKKSEKFLTPEEMACDFDGLDHQEKEKLYLLIFELWRRLCKNKESLSIFADSLDQLIDRFECQELIPGEEEEIAEHLDLMPTFLESLVALGKSEQEAFEELESYFGYDLSSFLYAFLLDLISVGGEVQAKKTIDLFYPFIGEKAFFDFLRLQIFFAENPIGAIMAADDFAKELVECEEPTLWLDFLSFLAAHADYALFARVYKGALEHLESEGDLLELLMIVADYYEVEGDFERQRAALLLLEARVPCDQEAPCILSYHERLQLEELVPPSMAGP